MPALYRAESGSNCVDTPKASKKFFKSNDLPLSLVAVLQLCLKLENALRGIEDNAAIIFNTAQYRHTPRRETSGFGPVGAGARRSVSATAGNVGGLTRTRQGRPTG